MSSRGTLRGRSSIRYSLILKSSKLRYLECKSGCWKVEKGKWSSYGRDVPNLEYGWGFSKGLTQIKLRLISLE